MATQEGPTEPGEQAVVKLDPEGLPKDSVYLGQSSKPESIMELGIGEALVSTLDENGQPRMVEHTLIKPPSSQVGPLTSEERKLIMEESPVAGVYDEVVDRESAYDA